jgi:hypothetical protein
LAREAGKARDMSNSRTASDGVFDLDAVIAETTNEPFTFVFAGRKWTIPHMGELDVWPLVAEAEKGDLQAARAVFEAAFGDEWAEFRAIPMKQHAFNKLLDRYMRHAGVKLGESRASTSS